MIVYEGTLVTPLISLPGFTKGNEYSVISIIEETAQSQKFIVYNALMIPKEVTCYCDDALNRFWKISENDVQNLTFKEKDLGNGCIEKDLSESELESWGINKYESKSETLTWKANETPKNISITITINY